MAPGAYAELRAEVGRAAMRRACPAHQEPRGRASPDALRQIDPSIPIIVVSGLALSADGPATRAPGEGTTLHLAKPYGADELLGAVRSLVRQ